MGDIAINTPTVQDESLQALNARVGTLTDQSLGFGVLEGTTKQQLLVLPVPAPLSSHVCTTTQFKSVINTATLKGAMDWEIITNTVPAAVDVGVQGRMSTEWRAIQEESVVVFQFKRIIAKRSMPAPAFSDLLPVKKGTCLDGDRWLVELYGNQICTTEYYGGEANIAFRWNHDAKVSITRIIAAIQSVVADTTGSYELTKSPQMSGLSCRTDIKGFKVPDRIQQKLTTVLGVMELISELSSLPIACAVLVKRDSIPIQTVTGFPLAIQVETHIREAEILEKLTQVELQIGKTDPLNRRAFDLVRHLKHTVEDASMSNRPLLPHLRDLANTVAETLAQHGRLVAVSSRNGEMRLCSDNKVLEVVIGVCIQASPVLWPIVWPARRLFQATQFRAAPVWTVPVHYELHTPRENPQMQRGLDYYTSAKLLLCFNDNEVLDTWRRQIDQLLLSRRFVADPRVKNTWFAIPTSAIFIVAVVAVVCGWIETG